MNFTFDSVEYRLSFRHQDRTTTAFLRATIEDNNVQASARCSKHDQFCKETGRKLALTRLLARFDKPFRSAVWKAYFDRKNPQTKQMAA